jgi:hypothetical protein
MRRLLALAAVTLLTAASAACNGSILTASLESRVDTVTVGALIGTPLSVPSGYSINARRAVRTDSVSVFDFAYNILPDGRRVFLPFATLGLGAGLSLLPGFIAMEQTFEQIREAPANGYRNRDTIPLAVGDRFVVRSSTQACPSFGVPKYAKLQVLDFDEVARLVRFQILVNQNCGFRSLQPGLPEN